MTAMTGIVIFGAGKIADVVYSSFSDSPDLSIAGFTCDQAYIHDTRCHGLPLVPFDEVQTFFPPSDFAMFVAIGYQNLNAVRAERCAEAQAKGYRLISWVSPRA